MLFAAMGFKPGVDDEVLYSRMHDSSIMGVDREALGIAVGESPEPARCAALFAQVGAVPDHVVPSFRW